MISKSTQTDQYVFYKVTKELQGIHIQWVKYRHKMSENDIDSKITNGTHAVKNQQRPHTHTPLCNTNAHT